MASGVFYGSDQLKKRINKLKLYVVRVSKVDGSLMNSRPCEHCIGLMREIGIKKVVYSGDNNDMIKENTYRMDEKQHASFGFKYMISHIYPNKYPDMTRRHSPRKVCNSRSPSPPNSDSE